MAGKKPLTALLEKPEKKEKLPHRWTPQAVIALVASLCLAVYFFIAFVPVRLVADYEGTIHEYETITDALLSVSAETLSGRTYDISRFTMSDDIVGETASDIIVRWGPLLKTHLLFEPIPFDHYTVNYLGRYYEKGELNPLLLTVTAIYADGTARPLFPTEYTFTAKDGRRNTTVMVQSIFGTGRAGNVPMIRFKGYEFDYPLTREGEEVSAENITGRAVYEDGTAEPVVQQITLTQPTAVEGNLVGVSGRFGPWSEQLRYIPIKAVSPAGVLSGAVVEYEDGFKKELSLPEKSEAMAGPRILSCIIQDDSLVVEVETDETEQNVYALFAGSISGSSLGASAGTGRVSIKAPFRRSLLREPLRVVSLSETAGALSSAGHYITNPEAAAIRDFPYPEQPSKKGLQVDTGRIADVRELGVRHSVVNIPMDKLLGQGFTYNYNGSSYSFNSEYIKQLDSELGALGRAGITTTAVLLMRFTYASSELTYPYGRISGHHYYGLNTTNANARARLSAIFSFLAERYSNEQYKVVNWILGNEIGNYKDWNYCGNISLEEYAHNYAESFRLLYNATRSVYGGCKCLISLDNCWNFKRSGAFTGREVLDAFAREIEAGGNIEWWVAYHAYSEPLTNTAFWNPNARVTDSVDESQMITIMNLKVLTDYVRETYGEEHKFILSENGFSSTQGEETQAAAIAYAYRLAEANDMVQSLVLHRHVDAGEEMAVGLWLGLRYSGGGAKRAWSVYKYMDTDPSTSDFALNVIGGESWDGLLQKAGFE